jgi:hypothetical protein
MNHPNKKGAATLPLVRCAIYTRKSTEEGLEQEFNSLDAQRESAQAFIRSQTHEGWTCLPERYDDGGFTGGNMERPALQRLLADIAAGKIDLESELTRLRLSPHNRPPHLSGPPLPMTAYWELANWLWAMRGGNVDTFGEKVASRWLNGFPLPAYADDRSPTPAEVERWRQTPLPDISADLRLVRPIADNFRHIVAGKSDRVTTKPFIPTARQRKILELLDGKTKKLAQLADKLSVGQSTLVGRDLKELHEQGPIEHSKRIGYYRPDAPPPELAGT